MKLVSVGLARSVWFMDVSELNPGGKDIFTEVVPALVQDYSFKIYPQHGGDFKEGMKFVNGVFTASRGDSLTVALTVWNDGIAADTYVSTKDSDEFLEEVLGTLPDLGFSYEPTMVRRKAYLSQLSVKSTVDLNVLNPKLVEFAKKISSASQTTYNLSAVEFWPDQTQPIKPANFSFQKKLGESPSDRYWSQAGMSTSKHLELLEELEAILA
jgi:hypothetical protein